jgi:hypothetical protein
MMSTVTNSNHSHSREFSLMSSSAHFSPSFHLQKVETVHTGEQTEIVFFDQKIEFVPGGAQLLLGVFLDPSGEGHLEELEGISVQIDADSGLVLDTLRKGQPAGKLDFPLSERTDVRLSIHIERHGGAFVPHLSTSDTQGDLGGLNMDRTWHSDGEDRLMLPAFNAPANIQLSAFRGYYSENLYHPEFGDTQMCLWPDDTHC